MARRKKGHGDGHDAPHADERWLITYADMITLLLAVFIVMYALSDTNLRKFNAFAQSLSAAFNTDIFQGTTSFTVTTGQDSAPDNGSFDSGQGVIASDYAQIKAVVADYAIGQGMDGQIGVEQVPEGIAIRISDSLLFEPGRARLAEASLAALARIAQTLDPLPNDIRVEGHTDDQAPTGVFYADNWDLSIARAMAVVDALQADGIEPGRLAAAGFGEYHPLVPNGDDAGRARNRRVDLVVLYPPTGAAPAEPMVDTSPVPFLPPIGPLPTADSQP